MRLTPTDAFRIRVESNRTVYTLRAESEEDARWWIAALREHKAFFSGGGKSSGATTTMTTTIATTTTGAGGEGSTLDANAGGAGVHTLTQAQLGGMMEDDWASPEDTALPLGSLEDSLARVQERQAELTALGIQRREAGSRCLTVCVCV